MNKAEVIEIIKKAGETNIETWKRYIKEESEDVAECIEILEKIPVKIIENASECTRGMGKNPTIIYPLNKKLITFVKKELKIAEIESEETIDCFGYRLYVHISPAYFTIQFKDSLADATCKLTKIGEVDKVIKESVYEISCK